MKLFWGQWNFGCWEIGLCDGLETKKLYEIVTVIVTGKIPNIGTEYHIIDIELVVSLQQIMLYVWKGNFTIRLRIFVFFTFNPEIR